MSRAKSGKRRPHLYSRDNFPPSDESRLSDGDRAARSLGYPPKGLSDRAGLALALDRARYNEG
ncbi:MAG: hypothetical protein SWY16_00110 [Cyanobacteriota bacterium]|nr:hypothetical protein [Cyanobacteriota bacterium]